MVLIDECIKQQMKTRILYLEILRIIAIVAVLINHVPLLALHLFNDSAGESGRFIVNGINHIVHFAVPIFVMITGALLLNKEKKKSAIGRFGITYGG